MLKNRNKKSEDKLVIKTENTLIYNNKMFYVEDYYNNNSNLIYKNNGSEIVLYQNDKHTIYKILNDIYTQLINGNTHLIIGNSEINVK